MTTLRTAGGAIGDRNIRAAELGFAGFSVVEHGTWLALLLYAFDRGGVAEAGLVAFTLLIPAAVLAPFASAVVERLPAGRALAVGFALQALCCGLVAVTMAAGASALLVYLAAAVLAVAITLSRPTLSAALPSIAAGPAELAAANSLAGFIETSGSFVGPAAAGFLILLVSPAAVFAAAAVTVGLAAALALTIRPAASLPIDPEEVMAPLAELLEGVRLLRAEPAPRLLVAVLAAAWIIFGALDVALVAVAVEQMGRSEATAGLLSSAVGLGGLIGAGFSFTLIGRRRLTTPVAAGLLAVGVPIMALAAVDSLPMVVVLLAICGVGDVVSDVAGRTLLQGLAAEDTLARVFGVLEGLATAGLAVGSIGFSLLAVWVGLEVALIAVGMVMPLLLLARLGRLREIDRNRPVVDPELLSLVRRINIFAPLPAFRVEQLLVNLHRVTVQPGATVFRQGDHGDRLYLVAAGSAIVELPDREAAHHPGGFFGEIALLRDQPRMATVRAGPDGLTAYTLDRRTFLDAISDFPRSHGRTVREADRRLGGE